MLTIAHTGDLISAAVEATFVCFFFYHRLERASSSKSDISSLLASWLAHAIERDLSRQRKWSRRCGHTGHRHILPGCNTDGPATRCYITLVQIRPSGNAPPCLCNHVMGRSTVLLPPDRKKTDSNFWHFRVFSRVSPNICECIQILMHRFVIKQTPSLWKTLSSSWKRKRWKFRCEI